MRSFILFFVTVSSFLVYGNDILNKEQFVETQHDFALQLLSGHEVEKNLERAKELFESSASKGYVPSIFMLAMLEDDYKSQNDQLKTAALKGHLAAMHFLGMNIYEGKGTEINNLEAFRWIKLAAEQGFVMSQAALSHMYANGIGTDKDLFESFKWRKLAAEKNDVNSQVILGLLYAGGIGVKQNFTDSLYWLGLACENKSAEGCKKYAEINILTESYKN